MKHLTYYASQEDAPAVLSPTLDTVTVAASRQLFADLIADSVGTDLPTDNRLWVHREAAIVRASFLVAEHLADTVARYRKAAA